MSFERGRLLVSEASLGMRIVNLKERIPEVAKLARKTLPKHWQTGGKLFREEWDKVQRAKEELPKLQIELTLAESERAGLRTLLHEQKAWG